MSKIFKLESLGLEVTLGKYAKQADGAVWIKAGNNIVLSTAVATKEPKDFMGFFPLTVEYRERPASAGKIPGGFIKREGKLSDTEVLTSREIDRPIRPLFPPYYFNEVQIFSTAMSSDGTYPLSVLALIGSSLALTISQIPFLGPVGAVRAGRIDGQWKFNISYEESLKSDADITVAGTKAGICMVEGNCNNVSEAELVDLFFQSHEIIKQQVDWQLEIQKEVGLPKAESTSTFDWEHWAKEVEKVFPATFAEAFYVNNKVENSKVLTTLHEKLLTHFAEPIAEGKISKAVVMYLFDSLLKKTQPDTIARNKKRFDGRAFDQVRPIVSEVGILPCAHGSAMFQRGETQVVSTLTLGTGQDAQKVETLMGGLEERTFMLHYNFPPFSTGEVRPSRGVGRRELGHGYLAETSFEHVLPDPEKFPYTIRLIGDVLESNGSSSMATVCAATLAMMDGGVPLKDMVSGVAMGLIKDSSGNCHVFTDISGYEDAFGLMDFKVTGTENGVMAIQLDIKDKVGLTRELLGQALEQARQGRLHILKEMRKSMTESRKDVAAHAPRVTFLRVPQDKIGAIIGPAGKNIKDIIARTGAQIDIEDDGTVRVYAKDQASGDSAAQIIKTIVGDVEVGAEFDGIVRRYAEFGMFVELVPGKDGLIHISTIAKDKQRDIEKYAPLNGPLRVKVVAYDPESGRVRLVAPSLEGDGGDSDEGYGRHRR